MALQVEFFYRLCRWEAIMPSVSVSVPLKALFVLAIMLCTATSCAEHSFSADSSPADNSEIASIDDGYWSASLPWHPKLVHLPMALSIVMPGVILVLALLIRIKWMNRRCWFLAAALQGILAVSAAACLKTGHDDAVEVEGYASDETLRAHDTRAHQFLYVSIATLGIFGFLLVAERKRSLDSAVLTAAILATLGQGYAAYRVGDAGGRLVYVGNASDAHK